MDQGLHVWLHSRVTAGQGVTRVWGLGFRVSQGVLTARGGVQGETWNETAGGDKYQRWWGENHHGNGWVQKCAPVSAHCP